MAIKNVHNKGFSLIELLVASALGLTLLTVVGSVFINGYTFAATRSLQLMLAQDVNDALKLMKEDIQRAGFVSGGTSSFVVSGATKTVYLQPPPVGSPTTCFMYAYDDLTGTQFRTFYSEDNKLKAYSSAASPKDINFACKMGQSMLDEEQMKVTKFEVIERVLSSATATSQYLTINLEVATLDDAISSAKSVQVKTRNWN